MYKIFSSLVFLFLSNWASAQNPSVQCLELLKNDPKIQPIADKVPFDATKGQQLEVLANKSKPTQREKAAISHFVSEGERCLDLGTEWRQQNFPPEVISVLGTYRVDLLSAFADLYAGTVTYGEFAKNRAKLLASLQTSVDSAVRDFQAKQEERERQRQEAATRQSQSDRQEQERREALAQQQRHATQLAERQHEEARRQAAIQLLLNQRPYQPIQTPVYQMPTPQRAPATRCTSYVSGGQLITNCN